MPDARRAGTARTPSAAHAERPGEAEKRPFDIEVALRRIEEVVRPFPKAAMFDLYERGHRSLFEQLVACLISIRTRDETSLPVALRLFGRARTPAQVAALSVAEIEGLIRDCAFHEPKARQIHALARRAAIELGGELPCDVDLLTSFAGVGPKCANLALGVACGQQRIAVDVHVHRVTNRWGYVRGRTPELTLAALEARLPRRHWVELNALLVPFGKHVCTGVLPRCSSCPVLDMCQQQGVTSHR